MTKPRFGGVFHFCQARPNRRAFSCAHVEREGGITPHEKYVANFATSLLTDVA